jgi:hypothetical protein
MKIILTESQLKTVVNEAFDDYKQSSIRGKTIGKIHGKLSPNKEVSVGSGSGKGFTSKYEKSEAKRKALIAKEKEKQENGYKNKKWYADISKEADRIKQDVLNREKPKPVEDKKDFKPIKIINGDYKPLKIITYAKQFENKNELRKSNPTAYTKIQKMGLMDKVFPPENTE